MSWPDEKLSEKWVDWSWFQNQGRSANYEAFDVDRFMDLHPEVDGAIIRACWPSGVKDGHYDYFYDAFTRRGVHVAAYLWPNPTKSLNAQIEDFKQALGDRIPPLLGYDYEDTGTFGGKTRMQLSALMRDLWDRVHSEFSESAHVNYSRAGWLDQKIIPGPWFHDIKWWLAHWIYLPGTTKQASHWSEVDELLPIGNSFTPFRGRVVNILSKNVVAWQFSARGEIVPRGYSDMSYFLKSLTKPIYGDQPTPPPDLPADLVPVEVVVPAGKTMVTVREVNLG